MVRLHFSDAAKSSAEEMALRRLATEAALRKGARQRVIGRMLTRPVHWRHGRQEDGSKIMTFALPDLKITMHGPAHVEILFRRDKPLPPDFVIGQEIPREQVRSVTDIYRAVRQVEHVRESCEQDLGKINEALPYVEKVNSILHTLKRRTTPEKIAAAIKALRPYSILPGEEAGAPQIRSGYKTIAVLQLKKTIRMLENTAEQNGPRINFEVRSACAPLASYREWLYKRFVRQKYNIAEYNHGLRATTMRQVRDRCARELLSRCADLLSGIDPETTARRIVQRGKLVTFFGNLEGLPSGRAWREPAMKEIDEALTSLPERLRKSVADLRNGIERGIRSKMMARKQFILFIRSLAEEFRNPQAALSAEKPEVALAVLSHKELLLDFLEKVRHPPKGTEWRGAVLSEILSFASGLPECRLKALLRDAYMAIKRGAKNNPAWNKKRVTSFIKAAAPPYRVLDPAYIAAQLKKSKECYTEQAIRHIEAALVALEEKKYPEAAQHFSDAAAILRTPPQLQLR